MHEEASSGAMDRKTMLGRFAILVGAGVAVGVGGGLTCLNAHQATACGVFVAIIFGTLFFWGFRLAIAFLGLAVLILTGSLNIPQFVVSSSLEVILFLVGMMVIVGALRDLGFFTWIVQLIVSMPRLTGRKFIFVTSVASALLACAVDEVTSIIFISTLIFQVCDRLKLDPTPYILIAVLATNIGSAGTMMGNPVGIYIGNKGQLSFGDFMIWAFPLMLLALLAAIGLLLFLFRRSLHGFDLALRDRLAQGLSLAPAVQVPYKPGLILIVVTICAIASHHPVESLFGLAKNSVLLITPLICAAGVMILKPHRARHYIEQEVDWWTLLFFMLLFAVAGTLEYTHVDVVMADGFSRVCGRSTLVLVPFVFITSAVGSAFVDNVIFVAAFCPVIEQLSTSVRDLPLWWALLFGACFGGNITMIGSTANIVALGMLEKRAGGHITFMRWFKVGILVTILSGAVGIIGVLLLSPLMPDRHAAVDFSLFHRGAGKYFDGKNVVVSGVLTATEKGLALRSPADAEALIPAEAAPSLKSASFIGKRVRVHAKADSTGSPEKYPVKLTISGIAELPAAATK